MWKLDIENLYKLWNEKAIGDSELISELKNIEKSAQEKYERFYKSLEFGTAGLRGIIGVGSNRMNIYTVRRATQGLSNYLRINSENLSVAISFDSRKNSQRFAQEAASVLAANDIKVYITKELQPTPVLSFCVRELRCSAGIMITASHNPAEYNGYKCYDSSGCQITDNFAEKVYNEIEKIDYFNDVKICDFNQAVIDGKIEFINNNIFDNYVECVLSQRLNTEYCKKRDISVVYTPLNGTGNKLVNRVLKSIGVSNLHIVKEQENPDENFITCKYPNPETKEALSLAIELAKNTNSDLIIATDPDSDRIGLGVRYNSEYRLLTGNEIGVLFLNYILESRKKNKNLPSNPVVVKTIVSTSMIDSIAKEYGCNVINVLTGFKYIGSEILKLEEAGRLDDYVFGFEESHGYLIGTYARDKDAVVASMLACEMVSYYKDRDKNLIDILNELYEKYGYHYNKNLSFQFEGSVGMEKMKNIMESLRNSCIKSVGKLSVISIDDYLKSISLNLGDNKTKGINLPKSDVLAYNLESDNKVIIRPSGTEPKIKVYIMACGEDKSSVYKNIENIESYINSVIK